MSFSYIVVEKFLTDNECKTILEFSLENLKLKPAEVINNENASYSPNIRKSNINFYDYYEKFPYLLNKISELINTHIILKGYTLNYKQSKFQFTKYDVGDYFAWHVDNDNHSVLELERYCSFVIQLNEEYDGGDLEIKSSENNLFKFKKGIGNIIIFLSNMEHRVTKVTKGSRFTLVNWVGLSPNINYKKTIL